MEVSKLLSCDVCGGEVTPAFYVARRSIPIHRDEIGALDLPQLFQGALGLGPDNKPVSEFFICEACSLEPLCLAELVEKRNPSVD